MCFLRSERYQRDHSQGDGRGGTATLGRIDILHYNVGMSIVGGDAPLDEITEDADWSADEALAEVWAACFCAFTFPRGCTPEVGSFSDPKVIGLPGSLFRRSLLVHHNFNNKAAGL